jgi:choline dehydrogenase-like flavoprotein
VIGAGAGGSVAANRLTEVKNWKVLVLEAGHYGNNFSDIPNMYFPIQFTDFNWGYNSTPQETACLGEYLGSLRTKKFNNVFTYYCHSIIYHI